MITATDNWLAANAKLAKKPIRLIEIEGYFRAFSNIATPFDPGFAIATGYQSNNFGGLEEFPQSVSLGVFSEAAGTPTGSAIAAIPGNLLIAVMMSHSAGMTPPSISDSNGNSWTAIRTYAAGAEGLSVWVATANSSTSPLTVNFVSGSNGPNSFFGVIEVDAAAGSYTSAFNSGTSGTASVTIGSYTLNIDLRFSGDPWELIAFEWGAGLAGQTYRFAFLFPGSLNLSGAVPSGWSETDVTLFPGQHFGSVSFSFSDILSLPWLVSVDPLTETVSDLDGGSDLSDLVFTVQDRRQLITADMAGFVFEGKKVVLKEGFIGLGLEDYLPRFTGKIESVDSGNANLEYTFTCPDPRKDLSQIIYVTGDDGFATSSDHPRTLNGHPLDILVDLLQNEIGWAASTIDIAKIQLWRDTIYSGVQFLFRTITSAPVAKDFIENEIMKPLGAYHRTNNLGIFTVNFFYPINPAPVAVLDHGTLTDVPVAQQAALVNQNVFRFDYDDSDKPQAEKVASYAPSIDKYALAGENIIESRGLRSAFGGYAIAAIVSRLIFLRYANKQLQFDGLPNIWSQSLLEPGDITSITSSIVPDRELGVLGITAKSFEILDRTCDSMNGIASFKLLAVDLSKFNQFKIAPNAEASFLSASPSDQGTYLFLSDDNGKYSDGTPANTLC